MILGWEAEVSPQSLCSRGGLNGVAAANTFFSAGDEQHAPLHLTCSIGADGLYRDANEAFLRVFGYTFEEVHHAPASALMRNHDPGTTEIFFRVRDAGGSASFVSWGHAKDGHRVDSRGIVTWNVSFQRWDVVLEVDWTELRGGPQYKSILDHIPYLEWQQAEQARRLDELEHERAHERPAQTLRHHRDRVGLLAQLRALLPKDPWDLKIETVRKGLDPSITDHTFKKTLEYHDLLVQGSVKKSLEQLIAEFAFEDGSRLLTWWGTAALLLYLMLDVLSDGRLDGVIDFAGMLST